jgi:hypothetical protein
MVGTENGVSKMENGSLLVWMNQMDWDITAVGDYPDVKHVVCTYCRWRA